MYTSHRSALHTLTNFPFLCLREKAHAQSPRTQIRNTRGVCLCVLVFVCTHAHWCLWISVRTPHMSLSSSAVLFLQLISLSATIMRPCWLTNLLMRCSTCTGHQEQASGGSAASLRTGILWMVMKSKERKLRQQGERAFMSCREMKTWYGRGGETFRD